MHGYTYFTGGAADDDSEVGDGIGWTTIRI